MSDAALVRELGSDLCAAVADLGGRPSGGERLRSTLRLLGLGAVLIGAAGLYWRLPLGWPAVLAALLAGVAYALVLIASHEMVHGTLLGCPRLEERLACLLGWPMAWPHLTYARLHRLHHRWNGSDPRDPERTTPLPGERQGAWPLQQLLDRHPLAGRCLLLGGVGLIADTALKGLRLQAVDRSLGQARRRDGVGVALLHAMFLLVALSQGVLGRYLLFWLLLERVIGAIVQFRGLVEHHGLWGAQPSHLLTQLYGSRNVRAAGWLNALMGGLPHHSAHHAFPGIPSARLPLASLRIAAVLERHGVAPVPDLASYGEGLSLLGGSRAGRRALVPGEGPAAASRWGAVHEVKETFGTTPEACPSRSESRW